jgi:hypothetical protein
MKNEYDANVALVNSKPHFVWSSDNFEQGINARKQIAHYNHIRESNVSIIQVIKAVLNSFFS